MKKKLEVFDLKPGMYVSELDRPWRDTPFLFQGFYIQGSAEIEQIKQYCKHVFVDTELSGIRETPTPPGPTDQRVEYEILKKNAQIRVTPRAYPDQTSLDQELVQARETFRKAKDQIATIMDDARVGRAIDSEGARTQVSEMAHSIIRNPDALICLTQLKEKDEYTAMHSLRVCILSLAFGRHLGLPKEPLRDLGIGALLHDVGKARVPTDILNKPGRLTADEFEIMKQHVPLGVKILENTKTIPRMAIDITGSHHERYNGNGYIRGLKGAQIGDPGMISAIADCYDAITSDRPYQDGISAHQALKKMYTWRDKEFHGQLIEQFIQCMGIYPIGSLVELNTGHVGVVATINRARYLRPRVVLLLDAEKHRYTAPRQVDLMQQMRDERNRPWEISSVLEPGTYGLNPAQYLPISA